jgi:hypothetical protein
MALSFLTSALEGGEWSASLPGRFTLGERTSRTHWIGSWLDPRAGLNAVENRKILHCRESNYDLQSTTYHYTDRAISTLDIISVGKLFQKF